MGLKFRLVITSLLATVVIALLALLIPVVEIPLLKPSGWVAVQQRNLILYSALLMSIVILPVFVFTAIVAIKYRSSNKERLYRPDWDRSFTLEAIWWSVPFAIIVVLSVITWTSTYKLDPFRPLKSDREPITIQVVSLNWKWLFIYPDQKIATVNYFRIPVEIPISFEITGDSPMNSFWLPPLGGQIFAMSGMTTQLHLIANEIGSYRGRSANLSGYGFAGMTFTAEATSESDFLEWVEEVKNSSYSLDLQEYQRLARPSVDNPVAYYELEADDLFRWVIAKYMEPPPHLKES